MTFLDKLTSGIPTLSFEFSPPKTPADWATLYTTLGTMPKLAPDFVSVTYGAGGSTRERTIDLVSRVQRELDIETVPHLTCVGHSKEELADILGLLKKSGIRTIMALRGDAPKGQNEFVAHPDGFLYASDLIKLIRDEYQFQIGCGFYPEKHPEASTLESDIEALKRKQDNGAGFATSQLFFDNDIFYRFRDKAVAAGVTIPLVVGMLPVTSQPQLAPNGFIRRCGAEIPGKLIDSLGQGDAKAVMDRGIDYAIHQSMDLLEHEVAGLHFYTMNRSAASSRVTSALRSHGYFLK